MELAPENSLGTLNGKKCPYSDPPLLNISQYSAENGSERAGRCLWPKGTWGKKKNSECSAVQKPWGNILGSRLSPQTFCNWLTFSSIKTDFVQGQRTLCFVHAVQEMVDQLPLFWGFLRFIIPSTVAGQGIESTQKETICSLGLFTIWMA